MEHQIAVWLFVVGAKWRVRGRKGNIRSPLGDVESVFVIVRVKGFMNSRLNARSKTEEFGKSPVLVVVSFEAR